ncbi:CLUMA_CG020359, isoform A [Clunio marinus]|uniref:CLUMA_CG020359, isoform A n=1 Tax=Clunio marinus TaxID=568069 RepID=A0A1J1J4R9_9DIPT|nr:CLUMA_CG020359, isoform A [Clunio marinus]
MSLSEFFYFSHQTNLANDCCANVKHDCIHTCQREYLRVIKVLNIQNLASIGISYLLCVKNSCLQSNYVDIFININAIENVS